MPEAATDVNLIWVCLIAFIGVMVLLAFLAGLIHLISVLFPVPKDDSAAFSQAVRQAVESAVPGARVVEIKEIKR